MMNHAKTDKFLLYTYTFNVRFNELKGPLVRYKVLRVLRDYFESQHWVFRGKSLKWINQNIDIQYVHSSQEELSVFASNRRLNEIAVVRNNQGVCCRPDLGHYRSCCVAWDGLAPTSHLRTDICPATNYSWRGRSHWLSHSVKAQNCLHWNS